MSNRPFENVKAELDEILTGRFAEKMRAAGIRRIRSSRIEIELEPAHPDTIPAPGFDPSDASEPEEKAAGTCVIPGCQERAGFHFAPHMCERHGMSGLGVKT